MKGSLGDRRIGISCGLETTNKGAFISNSKKMYYEILRMGEIGYNYGMPHWLSKVERCLAPFHFDKLFIGRNDIYHFRRWYRDELAGYLKEILLETRSLTRPYLKKGVVEKMLNAHIQGMNNYTTEISRILTTELTYRLLIEDI